MCYGFNQKRLFEIAEKFTDVYKIYHDAHPAIREALCLSELYPDGLYPLRESDTFAGTVGFTVANNYPVVFSPQIVSQIGYYVNISAVREITAEHPELFEIGEELIEFWKKESTFVKIREQALYRGHTTRELGESFPISRSF